MSSEIHQSLTKVQLVLGCDPVLLALSAAICFGLIFIVSTWASALLALPVWFYVIHRLRQLGKLDPQAREVYLRNVSYKEFHSAKSTRFRENSKQQSTIYSC